MLPIKLKRLHPDAVSLKYDHPGDAGMALYSVEDYTLKPGERVAVATGWAIEFSEGYVARILSRSGLAINHGISAATAGVIDSGYRGEWKAIMINLGQETYEIKKGDKIAQVVFYPIETAMPVEVDELTDTSRGEGGFGSTGR